MTLSLFVYMVTVIAGWEFGKLTYRLVKRWWQRQWRMM